MSTSVLTLNAGSSSLKFALFDAMEPLRVSLRGEIEDLDQSPHLVARDAHGTTLVDRRLDSGFDSSLHALLALTDQHLGDDGLAAVGHRIVHGGETHVAPERLTTVLLDDLQALTPLDPLHMPDNLAPVRTIAAVRPTLPQIACFDTAFHTTMPPVARRLAIPRALSDAGVRRYGFHGLSYEYIGSCLADRAPALAHGRVIVAHLGSGASLCAMLAGKSIETTTGFSALDGLVMGTRCGRLDPGVILHLGGQGLSFADIEALLYRQCGLLGVSGLSSDVRVLLSSHDPHAAEALELFVYRIVQEVGALASVLGGLDGLVFTAGIGEHAAPIRAEVCLRLAWLGVRLDAAANSKHHERISSGDSTIDVRVMATDEEVVIARHTLAAIRGSSRGSR